MASEIMMVVPRRVGRPSRGTEGEALVRILDAATPIFLSEGFEAASIDAISVAAGISKKTFYARFGSKADLFEAVCVRFIEQRMPSIEREAEQDGPIEERLNRIILAVLRIALTPDVVAFQRIVTAEAKRFPQFAHTTYDFGQSRLHLMLERCLEDGVHSGGIAVDDVRFAADYLFNVAIHPPVQKSVLGLERPEMTHVKRMTLKRTIDIFLRGYRA